MAKQEEQAVVVADGEDEQTEEIVLEEQAREQRDEEADVDAEEGARIARERMARGLHVVIGGNGHMGKHMQQQLLERGYRVRVADMNGEGILPGVEFEQFKLGEGDPGLIDIVRDAAVVYSMVTPNVRFAPRRVMEQVNHYGMIELLDACEEGNVGAFVLVSSLAVTNHLWTSNYWDEDHPLPPFESYVLAYDRSKRRGEEIVLKRNRKPFPTIALRCGNLWASPYDYANKMVFDKKPGSIFIMLLGSKLDGIGAPDYCTALILAGEALLDPTRVDECSGQALYCTMGKEIEGEDTHCGSCLARVAELHGLKCRSVNMKMLYRYSQLQRLKDLFDKNILKKKNLSGTLPYQWMRIPLHNKTFDNSRVRRLLRWEPQETVEDAAQRIYNQYIQDQKAKTVPKNAGLTEMERKRRSTIHGYNQT